MKSPCNKICKISSDGLCLGCLRTSEEIRKWPSMTEGEQEELINQLNVRKHDEIQKRFNKKKNMRVHKLETHFGTRCVGGKINEMYIHKIEPMDDSNSSWKITGLNGELLTYINTPNYGISVDYIRDWRPLYSHEILDMLNVPDSKVMIYVDNSDHCVVGLDGDYVKCRCYAYINKKEVTQYEYTVHISELQFLGKNEVNFNTKLIEYLN